MGAGATATLGAQERCPTAERASSAPRAVAVVARTKRDAGRCFCKRRRVDSSLSKIGVWHRAFGPLGARTGALAGGNQLTRNRVDDPAHRRVAVEHDVAIEDDGPNSWRAPIRTAPAPAGATEMTNAPASVERTRGAEAPRAIHRHAKHSILITYTATRGILHDSGPSGDVPTLPARSSSHPGAPRDAAPPPYLTSSCR